MKVRWKNRDMLGLRPSLLALSIVLLPACSRMTNLVSTELAALKNPSPDIPPLDRVVRPLGSTGKVESDTELKSVETANAAYYFLLGHELSTAGQTDAAIAAFERVRTLDPDSSYIHFVLAQEYLKKNSMQEGVASARKALELDPKNRDAKLLLANLFATAKKYPEAYTLFTELQKDDPDDEEVMLYLALMEIEQKNISQAYTRLQTFLNRNPDSALAYFYLGRLEQERGQTQAALKAYHKSVEIRPGFVQAGTYLAFLQEEVGDHSGAIETYAWLANDTDDATFHKKLGHLYLDNGDYPNALKSFENFERVDPTDLNNKVKIGLLFTELKEPEKAAKKFQEVLRDSPDSDNVRFYLGAVYEQINRDKDALAEYAKIPESSKLYSEAFRRRVFTLAKLKKIDEGWNLIAAALKAPSAVEGLSVEEVFEIGVNYWDTANVHDRSWQVLNEGLEKFPESERLLYLKGALFEKDNKIDQAIAAMNQILKKNPDHAGALNFVGYLWADKGTHLTDAERMIRRALKNRPKDPFITDSLAWVLFKRGQVAGALALLEQAFKDRPDEPVISDHMGDVLVKLGRFEEAKRCYELALKLGPQKDSDRHELESKLGQVRGLIHTGCNAGRNAECARSVLEHKRTPASEPNT